MSFKLTDFLDLGNDQEPFFEIKMEIEKGIKFSGSNFWILIAAIFLASLGLNVNSTAVVIGAMLISPLMGPIIGMGLAASINDLPLLKRAGINYLFATLAGLATSTLYFFISPLADAHSELLARTSPNIYDVLIAVFGGFAGIIALSSKNKGNVLPGVAIATALIPTLCTAGYGVATGQSMFLFGALYLYLINSVFIALATYTFTRIIKFPLEKQKNIVDQKRVSKIIVALTLITILPSIYFGYEMVLENRFTSNATSFIQKEISDEGIFVLRRQIDPSTKKIQVFVIGGKIDSSRTVQLEQKLTRYNLSNALLILNDGMLENDIVSPINQNKSFENLEVIVYQLNNQVDSLTKEKKQLQLIAQELPLLYLDIKDVYMAISDTGQKKIIIRVTKEYPNTSKPNDGIKKWLQHKLDIDSLQIEFL